MRKQNPGLLILRQQQSVFSMMWMCIAVFLLWTGSAECTEKVNISSLIEYTAAGFLQKMHSGKMMFVYFQQQVPSSASPFLLELEKSADVLQDYGVLVGKVNCHPELLPTYCAEKKQMHEAFLFRDGKEFLNFDLDTVFDVNSIVSEVLFAILRDEVKYVHTDADLLVEEKAARGRKDIVLGYVRSLGTEEHRSLMETAYVYGSKYQFILITGGPVLKYLRVTEDAHSSQVWFLHCKDQTLLPQASQRCPMTLMAKPLSTLSLHSFLQLMEAPLVAEVDDDPSNVPLPPFPNQHTPQVFLFSQPETAHLDRDTATALAWKLRGLALLVLVDRTSPAVQIPYEYNVAYRFPKMSSEVKYVTIRDVDDVLKLFRIEEETGQEAADSGLIHQRPHIFLDNMDDEIASAVFESRLDELDLDSVMKLTSDNFHDMVAQSSLTVALFYLRWDAVCMTFLKSFVELAERFGDPKVQLSLVDCGEWTDLCAAESGSSLPIPFQPITSFPTVLLLRPQESAQRYGGMLDAGALHRFIHLSLRASPALLSTQEEVISFLQGDPLAELKPDRVLGLFKTQTHTGVSLFTKAAKKLRGEALTGLLTDGLAEKWASEHSVGLPAVLVFPSWGTRAHPSTLSVSTCANELLSDINAALLHPLPELTVANLPSFLSLGKALLILFVGEEEDEIGLRQNRALVEEMRRLVETGGEGVDRYVACWIHLGRTPAGMSVLGSYMGSMPPLPALVLTHFPNGSEIYQYSPEAPITSASVLQWLQRVEDGTESPAGMLGDDSWPPAVEFHDFLKLMDMHNPDWDKREDAQKEEVKVKEQAAEEKPMDSSSGSPPADKNQYAHSEL